MAIIKRAKKEVYKLKHADKTQSRLFIVLAFIIIFSLFTGITYSSFVVSKELNAVNIKIADLNYTLFNDATRGSTNVIVEKGETKVVNFTLTSNNTSMSKYSLNYEADSKDVKVYYSHNQINNMSGIIGTNGASITMRVVIVNNSNTSTQVRFNINSGYVNKDDLSSNIIDGYYEEQLVKRTILLDENFDNAIESVSNPLDDSGYQYLTTVCTEDATITWNVLKTDIEIDTDAPNIACDIYFKKASKKDIELVYITKDLKGLNVIKDSEIDYTKYDYVSSYCNNDANISYDEFTHEVTITDNTSKTLCVVELSKKE